MQTKTNNQLALFDPSPVSSTPRASTAQSKDLIIPSKYRLPVYRVKLVLERDHLTEQILDQNDAARIACEMLQDADREVFLAMALSCANRVIAAHVCHIGTLHASMACSREVFKFAILANAKSVIVAHNHPSGNLEPSREDVHVSVNLKKAGKLLEIDLLDSLVIGHNGAYTSMAARGLI